MLGLVTGAVLIALGVLASASSIVGSSALTRVFRRDMRPDAQVYIDKLVPYQGWLGFIACLWGIWIIISAVLNLNWFSYVPIWWLTYAATGALIAALGLLLGYALLTKFVLSHNAEAVRRGEQVRLSVVPYQVTLGYVAIVLGIWTIVAAFFYRIA
jgi:hypothetical protein